MKSKIFQFKPSLEFTVFLLVLFIGIIIPLLSVAYLGEPAKCFDQADCDNPICPTNLECWDDRPGCIVSCKPSGEYCPMDSACLPYSGIETETCGYSPLTPSCNISANPSTINQGQSSTLTWSSDANSNCTASGGWSGSKPSSGSETVSPSSTTTYTLTCTNNCLDGSDSRTCSVTVTVAPFRHENCCDNSGWDNVRRCGGCCGVAANCVGYDPSAIYYWHDSNEVWQCSYADNQNSRYWFVEDCDSYDGCVGTTYHDWYCSGGACSYTDSSNDPLCVAPNILPRGYHDADEGVQDQSLCRAAGWATDDNDTSIDLQVRVFADGNQIATGTANLFRDLGGQCTGDTCAYNINIYNFITHNVSHTIRVQAQDAQTLQWVDLSNTPKTLTCTEPFDFSVSVSPNSGSTYRGGTTPGATVTVGLVSGTTQAVSLSASGLPAGATANFSPNSCNPTCASQMTITTVSSTPLGSFNLTITGTSGATNRTTNYTLDVVNRPPNAPSFTGFPPNNTWINYLPTFQAIVSDPDSVDTVRAEFSVSLYGSYLTNYSSNPSTVEWPLVSVPDGDWWWTARAQDQPGAFGDYPRDAVGNILYQLLRKDTVLPTATIDQENGTSTDTSIWVNLNESDERSGIAQGDVDIRTNSSLPTPTIEQLGNQYSARSAPCPIDSGTIVGDCTNAFYEYVFNFPANGIYNAGAETSNTGELRDQNIFHNVNVYLDGVLKGTFINPASDPATQLGWVSLGNITAGNHTIRYEWTNDWCGACSGGRGDSNILIHKVFIDDWQDYTSTINNFTYTGVNGSTYEFRYRVRDNANNWSNFFYDGSVIISINNAPDATLNPPTDPNCCADNPAYFFSWTYTDPDNDTESRYIFEVDEWGQDFSDPKVRKDISGLSIPSGIPDNNSQFVQLVISTITPNTVTYGNVQYKWRVKVYDSFGLDSGWVNGQSFTTPVHHYPNFPVPEFQWLPYRPSPEEQVQFDSSGSTCYDDDTNGSPCNVNDTFAWTFQDATPGAFSDNPSPQTKFQSRGAKTVTLTITDSDGYSCTVSLTVLVRYPLPKWREIKP